MSIKISCFFVFISAVFATVAANENCLAQIVASDNFDVASNLVSYSAIDAEGNDPDQWEELGGSGQDNFGVRSVADFSSDPPSGNFLSDATIDRSNTNSGSGDTLGVVTFDYADGNFFSIVDTDNGLNPSGVVTATWVFDISGAPSLGRFDIDAGAIGEFFDDGQGAFERFTWSYSIDGGDTSELIEFRGDSSLGPITYTLADGNEVTFDNAFSASGTALTNGDSLSTFSAPMTGNGDQLTLTLDGFINDNNASIVFDNIRISAIPEPSAFGILSLVGMVCCMRRRTKIK